MSADDTTAEPLVLVERPSERVAHVILNRPRRRNALTGPLADQLIAALTDVHSDDDVTVVVLRGAGGAFCSGLDLKEFSQDPQPDWVANFGATWRSVHELLFSSDRIVVGALERAAVNGGAALAVGCDLLVCGNESFLQVGEIQQGMAAPMNMAWLRLRFPESVAARLALIGDRVYGPELARLGVAYQSVEDDQVLAAVDQLTETLASHDPTGVKRIKASMRRTGMSSTAAEWFTGALEADPMNGKRMRPVAAT